MSRTALPSDKDDAETDPTFDQLMRLAVAEVDSANCLARKQTAHVYRAGRYLSEARKNLPSGRTWSEALEASDIPRTTAWEAMKLYEMAESEEEISSMTITEAKRKYGITKPRKAEQDDEPEAPSTISVPAISRTKSNGDISDDLDLCDDGDGVDEDKEESDSVDELDDQPDDDQPDEPDDENDIPLDQPSDSPFDTLAKVTKRLEYLETDLQEFDWQGESREAFLLAVVQMAEVLNRIRQAIMVEA